MNTNSLDDLMPVTNENSMSNYELYWEMWLKREHDTNHDYYALCFINHNIFNELWSWIDWRTVLSRSLKSETDYKLELRWTSRRICDFQIETFGIFLAFSNREIWSKRKILQNNSMCSNFTHTFMLLISLIH